MPFFQFITQKTNVGKKDGGTTYKHNASTLSAGFRGRIKIQISLTHH